MLVLGRREGQDIIIGDAITLRALRARDGKLRIGIIADRSIRILRGELAGDVELEVIPIQGVLPRWLCRFAWFLPRDVYEQKFCPTFADFQEDYLRARSQVKTKTDRACFVAAQAWRAFLILAQCTGTSPAAIWGLIRNAGGIGGLALIAQRVWQWLP